MQCKICGNITKFFSRAVVLDKHEITYYQCISCGHIQTEEPFWLEEAYSDAIATSDVGMISRNIGLSRIVQVILNYCFSKEKNFLDYGGGYGLFVRIMRDNGWNFKWYDKYCTPLFIPEFCKGALTNKYDVITAFELFEHFANPVEEIAEIFKLTDNIIFSTNLLPEPAPQPDEWWYFALDSGQHISFYTRKSLMVLADKWNKHYTGVNDIHIFLKEKIADWKIKLIYRYYKYILYIKRRKSLTLSDYEMVTGKKM
ncbi:MAG: class I SAM-dependent methyltransferase [Selenomonadaceae bacterium]